jgi:hypothetical protein
VRIETTNSPKQLKQEKWCNQMDDEANASSEATNLMKFMLGLVLFVIVVITSPPVVHEWISRRLMLFRTCLCVLDV